MNLNFVTAGGNRKSYKGGVDFFVACFLAVYKDLIPFAIWIRGDKVTVIFHFHRACEDGLSIFLPLPSWTEVLYHLAADGRCPWYRLEAC